MPATPPNNNHDVTPALLRFCPQTALDAVFGTAALVNADRKLEAASRNWDSFMVKSGRGDLARNAVLGGSVLTFFRNEDQKRVFESLLNSMTSDELPNHHQVVDLGTKNSPFYVQLNVQPVWSDGIFAGYFLHCVDVTREHSNRLTLIDHDRELAQIKQTVDSTRTELENARASLQQALSEKSEREKQITELTEKAARQAKSLKQAVQRAEQAAGEKSELEEQLKQNKVASQSDAGALESLKGQAANLTEEIGRRNTELETLKARCQMYEQEIAKLTGALQESNSSNEKISQESAGWQAQCDELRNYTTTLESNIKNLNEEIITLKQQSVSKPAPEPAQISYNGNNLRVLSRDLADQFGNLLTGVLGHASLAGADSGTAMDDIRAIERTAREAAQLVRKLSALSGSGRHSASTDLKAYLNRYAAKDHAGSFAAGAITLDLPKSPCTVVADGTTLDVLCDAIARFAYPHCDNEKCCWNVLQDDHNTLVSVVLSSEPRAIPGWFDGAAPLWNQEGYELYFAREAARGLGGDVEITSAGNEWNLLLTLPAAAGKQNGNSPVSSESSATAKV